MGFVNLKCNNLPLLERSLSRLVLLGCQEDECTLISFCDMNNGDADVVGWNGHMRRRAAPEVTRPSWRGEFLRKPVTDL